jgi:glycosyltransferase involved in cell wall biosynthesis
LRVLGFGTYDRARHPRVGIVLDGLREHGDDVTEVNVPLGFTTAERVAMLGRPWQAYRLVLRLLRCWATLAGQARRARRRGRPDVVVVGYLGHFDVLLARLLFPRTRIVLDLLVFAADTARDRGQTSRLKLAALDRLDGLAVGCADVVMLDTPEHAALLPGRATGKAVVVPVGAGREWFAAGAARRASDDADPLTVVFFGLYTPLQGAPTIGAALRRLADRPDIAVTMIGSGQDLAATQRAAADVDRVTWLPWVDPTDLPALVAGHDICLGIVGTTPKGLRVVPNKVFQGAAAGCAILTSDTEPQRALLKDAARYVPPGDPAALATALAAMADDRPSTRAAGVAARAAAEQRFAPGAIVVALRSMLLSSDGRPNDDK